MTSLSLLLIQSPWSKSGYCHSCSWSSQYLDYLLWQLETIADSYLRVRVQTNSTICFFTYHTIFYHSLCTISIECVRCHWWPLHFRINRQLAKSFMSIVTTAPVLHYICILMLVSIPLTVLPSLRCSWHCLVPVNSWWFRRPWKPPLQPSLRFSSSGSTHRCSSSPQPCSTGLGRGLLGGSWEQIHRSGC